MLRNIQRNTVNLDSKIITYCGQSILLETFKTDINIISFVTDNNTTPYYNYHVRCFIWTETSLLFSKIV